METTIRNLRIAFFPKRKTKVATPTHEPSISAWMGITRHQVLAFRGRGLRDLFQCWRHLTQFHILQKAIRKQSRLNKRAKLDRILSDGDDFALQGKTFDWYRKVWHLCPKQPTRRIQLFDDHGMPLPLHQEVLAIEKYYIELLADPDLPAFPTRTLDRLPFTGQDVLAELMALPGHKALAPDGIPALIWKPFAEDLIDPLMQQFHQIWVVGPIQSPKYWTTGWIHLLSKCNKVPNKPQALRPICLQHPINKSIVGIQCKQIVEHTFDRLRRLPLYAYLPMRGIRDCLLIISDHCRTLRSICQQPKHGVGALGLAGGLQVSFDMEKAFDTVSRQLVLYVPWISII